MADLGNVNNYFSQGDQNSIFRIDADDTLTEDKNCLLYTSPSPRD